MGMNQHRAVTSLIQIMNRIVRSLAAWLSAAVLATLLPLEADAQSTVSYTKSNIFFELNHTDGDLGIHAQIDGDGWHRLQIDDPEQSRMLNIEVQGRLRGQGLTELFTESAEPPFNELPPSAFFDRFPEGQYAIRGTTLDGKTMAGTASLTHVMPAPPANIRVSGLAAPQDCDNGPVPAATKPVVISWDLVTRSHPEIGRPGPVEISNYQLVVEREEPTSLVLAVDLPLNLSSFELPESFVALDSGDGFKFEIVVREASGNQTVLESCFELKDAN